MKRFFFSLIALSAAAIGCTQSALVETPEILGKEISFTAYAGRTPETKASTIDDIADLADDGFKIFCYLNDDTTSPYMDRTLVKSNNNGVTWYYEKPILYWPDPSSPSTLSFVAYSANAEDYLTNKTTTSAKFTVPVDVKDQVDFLATALQKDLTLNNTPGGNVNLKFNHLLSRVGFKVKATKASDRKITISQLSFTGTMPQAGTINFLSKTGSAVPELQAVTSSPTPTKVTYNFLTSSEEFVSKVSSEQIVDDVNGTYMMIMPHKVEASFDHTITVEYHVTGMQDPKEATVDLPRDFEFKAGKAYEFILSIATSAISFSVTETDWTPDSDQLKNPYPLEPEAPAPIQITGVQVTGGTTATVIMNVTDGSFDEIGIEYKVKNSNDEWSSATSSKTSVGTHNISLTNLAVSTEYVCRAYSIKNKGADDEVTTYYPYAETDYTTFITKGAVSMNAIDYSKVSTYTATISAKYEGTAAITEKGFCIIEAPGTPNLSNSVKLTKDAEFITTFTGLKPITTYKCCAYVRDAKGGYSYSEVIDFTTAPNLGPEPGTDPDQGAGNESGSDNLNPWEGEEDKDGDGDDDDYVQFG